MILFDCCQSEEISGVQILIRMALPVVIVHTQVHLMTCY